MLSDISYLVVICSINVRENRGGNLETLSTLNIHDTGRRQKKSQKHSTTHNTKKMSNTDPTKKGANPGTRELQVAPAS